MRKNLHKQMLELAQLLSEAHEEIKKALDADDGATALSVLEQCQQAAVSIGTTIENEEGEGFVTVSYLERYCETAYQLYEEIAGNRVTDRNKQYKILRRQQIQIENSIKNDIRVRTVAVFLPYKASMWDSLESVWMAAHDDPDCDDYVIPIPYFDKNPDGSFRELHYEGGQYPAYVPITDYETFDFEGQHPDAIYIHNPYDEWNFVTSVPPFFYSKNLKNFTDMLVYIPYFVLGEMSPDNEESIEKIEHFCVVPGVFNADRVIVQSEDIRKIYIKVLVKQAGEESRSVWEKKILGLGSPKYDKVVTLDKGSIEIPEKWRKIIEKPDGGQKKVIFYNTSINALLQHNEKMLEKMRWVFAMFKENQGEVALLWRPHPLIQATVSSMRPQLWAKYEKLLLQYREEGWGIYDDTADLDRAIAVSDAYYGDASSVVQLFKKTGKPIMIQDVEVRE